MTDVLKGLGNVPLLRIFPNWVATPRYSFLNSLKILEYQGTADDFVEITNRKPQVFSCEILLASKEEEYNFLTFWHARKGTFERFWLPIYPELFELKVNVLSAATTLTCAYTYVKFNNERIYIHMKNDDLITAKVNNFLSDEKVTKETILFLSDPIGYDVYTTEIESFGLLLLCKFAKDHMELNYENNEVARVSIEVQEVIEYGDIA